MPGTGKEDDDDDSVGWLLCSTRVIIVFGAFIIATFLPIRQCRRKDTFFACLCLPVSVTDTVSVRWPIQCHCQDEKRMGCCGI